ncbi:response regulator [Pontibacillus marinus]|uniref:Response regulator n=1 Tax=Pontibacillus marinus BH030004 = DSM 16465 TaxID=1385511 RepID=A0A0A5GF72_9BACI|nr:response regulator [Pontibacillus marinus]KGX90644.1 response regulator [Pontibacillus marinus BH030004 = DSM 16465]
MNILIIDDDPSLRYMLTEICKHAGWDSEIAENGQKGVDLFQEGKYDLILVDYHMPEMDGIQTVKAIRSLHSQIPILVLTVDERQEIADRFLQEGANDFALKPVKAPDIISRIQLHVQLANLKGSQAQDDNVYSSKGISKNTLTHIEDYMKKQPEPSSVDEISKEVNLAYPTVYRYVTHLLNEGKVKQIDSHQKMGRPKKLYQWYSA